MKEGMIDQLVSFLPLIDSSLSWSPSSSSSFGILSSLSLSLFDQAFPLILENQDWNERIREEAILCLSRTSSFSRTSLHPQREKPVEWKKKFEERKKLEERWSQY